MAVALQNAGRFPEAAALYERACTECPASSDILFQTASFCVLVRDWSSALTYAHRAFVLSQRHRRPPFRQAEIAYLLAVCYAGRRDFQSVAEWTDMALGKNPKHVGAHAMAGQLCAMAGEQQEATRHFNAVLDTPPDCPEDRVSRSALLLANQEWANGWAEQEARYAVPQYFGYRPKPWSDYDRMVVGEDHTYTRLCVVAEQGLGDTILFARYWPLLEAEVAAARLGTVTFVVQDALLSWARHHYPTLRFFPNDGTAPPGTTHYTFAFSMPHLLGLDAPPPHHLARWTNETVSIKRIGYCWRGASGMEADADRSIPLDQLHALLDPLQDHYDLVNLTHGTEGSQTGEDMLATEQVATTCDLIISVDTSLAHLTAHAAIPTWVFARTIPDMRALSNGVHFLDGSHGNLWWPSVRTFFRQHTADWPGVFHNVHAALAQLR